jgi:hypothetical protein
VLNKKHSSLGTIVSIIFVVVIVAACLWLFFNRTFLQDQLAAWGFKPSAQVASLEKDIDLTNTGTFYFNASAPQIDNATDFNAHCPQQEINNPILGCYSNQHIYVYDVTEADLNGIQQVTAAHEMLHAIWARMSASDHDRIGALLQAQYDTMADKDLQNRMSYYQRNEPGEFINELHSIIGTEVGSLSPELESYYGKYFKDRQKIVTYHAAYSKVFTDLANQADTLSGELTTLGADIDKERADYEAKVQSLSSDIDSFNKRAANGSFSSQSQFYSERNDLVDRTNQLDAERTELNQKIDTYNQKYETYQDVASRIQQLNGSIDSMSTVSGAPEVSN